MTFKFKQFVPRVPSNTVLHVYEEIFYRAVIEVEDNVSPRDIIVEVLTTQRDQHQPDGTKHSLRLFLRGPLEYKNMYVYGTSAILISMCTFEFSYRAKCAHGGEWITPPTQPEVHGIARVLVTDPTKMTKLLMQQPNFSHIIGPLYIGDATTLEQVPLLDFTHVLCVDSDLPVPFWVETHLPIPTDTTSVYSTSSKASSIAYSSVLKESPSIVSLKLPSKSVWKKIVAAQGNSRPLGTSKKVDTPLMFRPSRREINETEIASGTNAIENECKMKKKLLSFHRIPYVRATEKPIEEELIKETVNWIKGCWHKSSCILIASSHGFLRAGIAALAFIYSQNSTKSFESCFDLINRKRPIFLCHDTKKSLEDIFRKDAIISGD